METRAKFVEYMTNMFKLLGDSPEKAAAEAKTVLDFQTRLAVASLTPVERRNPDNPYNKISVDAAQQLTPNFSWTQYFTERSVPTVSEMNIAPPEVLHGSERDVQGCPDRGLEDISPLETVNSTADVACEAVRR